MNRQVAHSAIKALTNAGYLVARIRLERKECIRFDDNLSKPDIPIKNGTVDSATVDNLIAAKAVHS